MKPSVPLVLCGLGLAGMAPAEAENRLFNADFEEWSGPAPLADGWFLYTPSAETQAASQGETITDARTAFHGSRCVKITSPGIRMHLHKEIAVRRGEEYVLTVHARGEGEAALGVYELGDGRFLQTVQDPATHTLTATWTRLQWRYTPSQEETTHVRFIVWSQGTVFLDTAAFQPAASFQPDEVVAVEDRRPLLAPPFIDTPPVIDGKISPGEWTGAARQTGWLNLEGRLAAQQTTLYAAYDATHLYFAFVSHSPSGIKATVTEPDGPVYGEDAFEIFLQPEPDGPYFQFAGNALDTRYEGQGQDGSWDAEWQLASQVEKDVWLVAATWTAELALPFKSLGRDGPPADGTVWRANFCRDWTFTPEGGEAERSERWTTWAPVGGDFHNPDRFGTLLFSRTAPAVRLQALGDLPRGLVALEGEVVGSTEEALTLTWAVFPEEKPDQSTAGEEQPLRLTPGQVAPFLLAGRLEVAGATLWPVQLVFSARDGQGRVLHRSTFPYQVIPAFRVDLLPVYTAGFLEAVFDIRSLAEVPESAFGQIQLTDLQGQVVAVGQLPDLGREKTGALRLDFGDRPAGDYHLTASLLDPQGQVLAAKTERFPIPERPAWFQAGLGLSEKVPPPFTDVQVAGRQIAVWGRTYSFAGLLFPSQITIQGEPFLAGPMQLTLTAAGTPQPWQETGFAVREAKPTQTTLFFQAQSPAATLEGTARVEYDGFAFFDFTLTPPEGERPGVPSLPNEAARSKLDGLTVELPLWRAQSPFLRASGPIAKWPEGHSQVALIGDVKADKEVGPDDYAPGWSPEGWTWGQEFVSTFWVGDDHRGLFCYQDREENRHLRGQPLEVATEGEVTRLRLHLINVPTSFDRPLRYTLALQATPLKPRLRQMERLAYVGGYNLEWTKEQGLTDLIPGAVLWKFGRIEKDYQAVNPDQLKALVAAGRAAGLALLPNHTLSFCATPYPDFDLYRSEWVQEPYVAYPNHEGTDVSLVAVCPRSSFADYYLSWVQKMIEEYDIGGLYFDLSGWSGCSNPRHGCGYQDGGEWKMTSNIFALRELYQRLYTFLQEEGARRGREFYIFQHSMAGPITAFVDMVTVGEGWSAAKDWSSLTPVRFRAAESLRPLGTAGTFYPAVSVPWYRVGQYCAPHDEALARALIHDVLPVALWTDQTLDLAPLWRAWEDFDVESATWIPYFDHDPRLSTTPDSLLVSLYQQQGQALVVVANLTDQPVSGQVRLDLAGLELPPGDVDAVEVRSGQTIPVQDGLFSVEVAPLNVIVVRLPSPP